MGFDLKNVRRQAEDRAPRILLIGEEKVGKTTFASQFDSPIIIPVMGEEGCDHVGVAKTDSVKSVAELMDVLGALCEQEHEFKTVVIDSLSALEPLVWQQVCKDCGKTSIEQVGGGFGKGYIEALSTWREITTAVDYLRNEKGMASILIGHVRVKSFSDPSGDNYDRYELDLNKQAMALFQRWADCLLFARWKSITKKTGRDGEDRKAIRAERVLCCQTTGAFPAGGRGVYGHLPSEVGLTYNDFNKAIQEARRNESF